MPVISTDTPVIANLAPGRYRVSVALTDGRLGKVCVIAGRRTLIDDPVRDFASTDLIVTHTGGSVALWTTPHIPGRKPPSVTLQFEEL